MLAQFSCLGSSVVIEQLAVYYDPCVPLRLVRYRVDSSQHKLLVIGQPAPGSTYIERVVWTICCKLVAGGAANAHIFAHRGQRVRCESLEGFLTPGQRGILRKRYGFTGFWIDSLAATATPLSVARLIRAAVENGWQPNRFSMANTRSVYLTLNHPLTGRTWHIRLSNHRTQETGLLDLDINPETGVPIHQAILSLSEEQIAFPLSVQCVALCRVATNP